MNLLNQNINHMVFGEGQIIQQEESRIYVQFSAQYGVKRFVYPDAFNQYLKLYDNGLQTIIMEELQEKKMQAVAEKIRNQQKYEELRTQAAGEKCHTKTSRKTTKKK